MTFLNPTPSVFTSNLVTNSPLSLDFFGPLLSVLSTASNQRTCHQLTDQSWLFIGTRRALETHPSGRGFLQHLISQGLDAPNQSHFFETLKSERRLALTQEVSQGVASLLQAPSNHGLAQSSELNGFDLYAGDGHYHAAAAHDPRHPEGEIKYATGHFFSLNLRTHALCHLSVADQVSRKKEHDMRALKRMDIATLRQGAPKGRKVLHVWDRAGIDFRQWYRWKHGSGIYFLSRVKENMTLEVIGQRPVDYTDPRNQGVIADEIVSTSQGVSVRKITYHCVLSGRTFEFITNEESLPPGLLAHLYRIRWDIEKTFDELKNKLEETKAWGSSATAKTMQAHFLCLAHNLMILFEQSLEKIHGIRNEAEIARKDRRLESERIRLAKESQMIPTLYYSLQRITQRSLKFIRWLRVQLFSNSVTGDPIDALRRLFAFL